MQQVQPLLFEIKLISNLFKRQIDNAISEAGSDNLTGMQGFIIGYLSQRPDMDVFQRDIEMEFNIRRSTATGILQLMEKNALIERHPVPYDARLKKLRLTQKAINHHENFMSKLYMVESKAVKGLTDSEISALYTTLNKIKKNVE